jgi:hypothetical protein
MRKISSAREREREKEKGMHMDMHGCTYACMHAAYVHDIKWHFPMTEIQ